MITDKPTPLTQLYTRQTTPNRNPHRRTPKGVRTYRNYLINRNYFLICNSDTNFNMIFGVTRQIKK